jgi:hypothetical protein
LGSGGADAGFLARCEGEGDAFFFFSRAIRSADACGTSGVGTVRSGGARGKAQLGVKARRWTGKGEPMELSYFHSFY